MAAVATSTSRATIGLMVGANTFRNPALVAKMVTTLDHISGGRAMLGIGAAWFETEHRAFGMPFGGGPGERLRWLGEALPILRGMLDGNRPSAAAGSRYAAREALNLPAPVQRHVPILIGGSGPQGDAPARRRVRRRLQHRSGAQTWPTRRRRCWRTARRCGRDEREIERTSAMGTPLIRDTTVDARAALDDIFAHNGGAATWQAQPVGTVDEVVALCEPFVRQGYRHLVFGFPSPYDDETMTRLATEVRPRLEALVKRLQEGAPDA